MISPSDGVPEWGLDWSFVATEACGGGTSDLGLPRRVLEYLGFYRVKKGCGMPPRWAQPTKYYNHGYHDPIFRAYNQKHRWKLNMSEYRQLQINRAEKPDYL